MFNVPNTRKNRVAAIIAIILGLSVGFYMSVSDKKGKGTAIESDVVPGVAQVIVPPRTTETNDIMRIADIDFRSYNKELANGIELQSMESLNSAIVKIETYFTPHGGNLEGYDPLKTGQKTESVFSSFDAEGGKVMVVERINMRDDSIKAEQFYAIFKKTEVDEILVDYGMKIKCHRGDNTTYWQADLCP